MGSRTELKGQRGIFCPSFSSYKLFYVLDFFLAIAIEWGNNKLSYVYGYFFRLRIEFISQFIMPVKIVPIKIQTPINPYPIPLQPPINRLIMIMAILIIIKAEKPALRYLSFCTEPFRTMDAAANKMLITNKIEIKTLKPAILSPPELTYFTFGCTIIVISIKKATKFTKQPYKEGKPI